MNNTNDTSFIHTFTLLILGLTSYRANRICAAQIVANKAEEDEVISQNVIERIQTVGVKTLPVNRYQLVPWSGWCLDSIESIRAIASLTNRQTLNFSQNLKAVASSNISKTGKQVYDAACAVCHGAGVAGAPKFGDNVRLEVKGNERRRKTIRKCDKWLYR